MEDIDGAQLEYETDEEEDDRGKTNISKAPNYFDEEPVDEGERLIQHVMHVWDHYQPCLPTDFARGAYLCSKNPTIMLIHMTLPSKI